MSHRTLLIYLGNKKNIGIFIFLFTAIHLHVEAQPATGTSSQTIIKNLDEYLTSAAEHYKFNGSVLVAKKGNVLLHKGYGFKDALRKIFNDSNTIFQICSITKQFTAAVILKLQEEGKLSVEDKLSKYFPAYKYGDKITLVNLLTHTSGIYNYTNDIDEDDSAIVCNPVSKQRVLDAFNNKPLDFNPGTKFSYGNSNYYLLGLIIEKVTGRPYEDVLRETIFTPLTMNHSGFDFRNLKDTFKATGYKVLNENNMVIAQRWDSTVTYAAGAVYSTTADMYRWAQAVAKKEIISGDSWQQAFTPHLDNYGYGWWIDSLYGKIYVTHSGGMPGFMSNIIYYPQEDVTIILLNNEGNYGESLLPLNRAVSAIVFSLPYNNWETHMAIKVDEKILRQYVGVYAMDDKPTLFITLKKGQLYAKGNSAKSIPKLPIYAESDNRFYLQNFNVTFTLIKNPDGQIIKIVCHENGKDIDMKKIE
ncbi:MAG: serine hydrolase [Ginsengibacter sp.]